MSKSVTVYTSDNCAYCEMVKKYLNMKKIEFSTINVSHDQEAQGQIIEMTGARTTPVTVVEDGDKKDFVVGYNLPKLSSLVI